MAILMHLFPVGRNRCWLFVKTSPNTEKLKILDFMVFLCPRKVTEIKYVLLLVRLNVLPDHLQYFIHVFPVVG